MYKKRIKHLALKSSFCSIILILSSCSMMSPYGDDVMAKTAAAKSNIDNHVKAAESDKTNSKKEGGQVKVLDQNYVSYVQYKPLWEQGDVQVDGSLTFDQIVQLVFSARGVSVVNNSSIDKKQKYDINFSGSMSDFVSFLSERLNKYFQKNNNSIVVNDYATKTFYINAMPGNNQFQISSENDNQLGAVQDDYSSISSSGGGSNEGSKSSAKGAVDIWQDVKTAVEKLESKNGSYSIEQSSSVVTVTDTVKNLAEIGAWVKAYNKMISKQVLLKVQVLTVKLNKNFNRGIDFKDLTFPSSWNISNTVIGAVSAYNPLTDISTIGTAVNSTKSSIKLASSIIQYLQTKGQVYLTQEPLVTTLNNHAAQVEQTMLTGYVKQVTTTTSSSGSTTGGDLLQASLEPGAISSGIKLSILPHIQDDKVVLRISVDLSTIEGIKKSGSLGKEQAEIDLPVVENKEFNQISMLNNGQTLLMGGYISHDNEYNNVKNLGVSILGANSTTQATYETVLLITPYIQQQ
ncbi:type II secretion system protein GspD [Cysteiniphilum halobium]|uniref:type II secretion system protein GspD n=1 Tax=Cysteiniphilum halobium TaxID=2219059 RepID=UPI003F834732